MNYIAEAEIVLKDHKKLFDSLKNLEARRTRLIKKGVPRELQSNAYDKPAIQHFDYSEDTINQICEITEINADIKSTEEEMKIVEEILKQIKKENAKLEEFIRLRYLNTDRISLKEVAIKIGYSEDSNHTIYEIRKQALREFAILYFGTRAQRNI
jgi:hypothetical protein